MANFNGFDKLNIPLYICSPEMEVIYRNRASKKFSASPRLHSNARRLFLNDAEAVIPSDDEIKLVCCKINDTIKTALCFNYHGNLFLAFFVMFDYDLLYSEFVKNADRDFVKEIRNLLDYILEFDMIPENGCRDRFGIIEKVRAYTFSCFDNYLALSLFRAEDRYGIPLVKFFRYFNQKILPSINKSGYRVETEYSDIFSVWENFYVDAVSFSGVFSNLLLFALEISKDRKCIVETEHLGTIVRTKIKVSYAGKIDANCGGLAAFGISDPVAYLNVMSYEEFCKCISWNVAYKMNDEEKLNLCIYFDSENDTDAIFNSGVGIEEVEKLFEMLMEKIRKLFA